MQALRARGEAVRELAQVRDRVSTGLRVAGPKDEAASYIIAKGMKSQVAAWGAVLDSLARGQATVSVASEGVRNIADVLIRTRERLLSLASATDVDSREQLRQDIRSLVGQSDAIARLSTYGEVNLLAGAPSAPSSQAAVPPPQPADFLLPNPTGSGKFTFERNAGALAGRVELVVDLGPDGDMVEIWQGDKKRAFVGKDTKPATGVHTLAFDYDPAKGQTLSFRFNERVTGSAWSVTSLRMVYPAPAAASDASGLAVLSTPRQDKIKLERRNILSGALQLQNLTTEPIADALTKIEAALGTVNSAGAYYGGLENELERQHAFGLKLQSNLESQVGALVNADLARESARLIALQTREQLANTSLSIASSSTRILLELFQPAGRGFGAAA